MNTVTLEATAREALAGNRASLGNLVEQLHGDVFKLSVRMLWNREDAEDATQEILVRVVTRLSSFDFLSSIKTWVYRIAVNYLLDVKKSAVERMNLNTVSLSEDLQDGLIADDVTETDQSVLIEEVKIGCTLAMLQCLDRPHRLAYILGEIFDLSGPEAAGALSIDAAVLRKRLERARSTIAGFTQSYCGLVSDDAACRCNRRVATAVRLGRVRADAPQFATGVVSFEQLRETVRRVGEARAALEVHRTNHPRGPSTTILREIMEALETS